MATAAQATSPTPSTAPAGGATDMARKPTIKKDWGTLFKTSVKHDQEVPVAVRTGRSLPFPFDGMKLNSCFFVPKEFWLEFGGLKKEQAEDKARNKEAIRRSFYNWRDKEPKKREGFALSFSDQYEGQDYTGVNVYLVERTDEPTEKPAKAASKPAAAKKK